MNEQEFMNAQTATMLTVSGVEIDLLCRRPNDYRIEDIAHHLAMLCRYTGAVRRFYSVAEHCVHVSRMVADRYALEALLHDATEAYMNDLIRPIKHLPALGAYREIELELELDIREHFGLPLEPADVVTVADREACRTEKYYLKGHGERPVGCLKLPGPWSPAEAKKMFLRRYHQLTPARRHPTRIWFF